jgi:hypothetical protein
MNAAPTLSVAAEINRLHAKAQTCVEQSRQALDTSLTAAWNAGILLQAEKKRIRCSMGPGSWLLWLEANFRGNPRTAQRYMKLARSVTDASFLQGMSLRQAYDRLGIATEPKTTARSRLVHQLPAHLILTNKLMRALKRELRHHAPTAANVKLLRDLRPLFDILNPWFALPEAGFLRGQQSPNHGMLRELR